MLHEKAEPKVIVEEKPVTVKEEVKTCSGKVLKLVKPVVVSEVKRKKP
jgi:hypothetical protein